MDKEEISNLCPATYAFDVLGGKWNLIILAVLCEQGPMRYKDLQRSVKGITGTMLTRCLKELTEYGIVSREHYVEIPPRVEYSLTKSGKELGPILEQIVSWGQKNLVYLDEMCSVELLPKKES